MGRWFEGNTTALAEVLTTAPQQLPATEVLLIGKPQSGKSSMMRAVTGVSPIQAVIAQHQSCSCSPCPVCCDGGDTIGRAAALCTMLVCVAVQVVVILLGQFSLS